MRFRFVVFGALATIVSATPRYNSKVFDSVRSKRQASEGASSFIVDLGYERYQGVANTSTGLNTWKGIRYAAPPTGSLRWQPPKTPAVHRGEILQGNSLPQRCPQAFDSPTAPGFNFTGDEDCLFLSVYAPSNATNLPVLVWIHGGGYGMGQGNQDMSSIINANHDGFIAVAIQYRVSRI